MSTIRNAKFQIGQVVRHRLYPFRGVVFDIGHGAAHEPPLLPANVKVMPAPEQGNQKDNCNERAEQKFDGGPLCSFD